MHCFSLLALYDFKLVISLEDPSLLMNFRVVLEQEFALAYIFCSLRGFLLFYSNNIGKKRRATGAHASE